MKVYRIITIRNIIRAQLASFRGHEQQQDVHSEERFILQDAVQYDNMAQNRYATLALG